MTTLESNNRIQAQYERVAWMIYGEHIIILN